MATDNDTTSLGCIKNSFFKTIDGFLLTQTIDNSPSSYYRQIFLRIVSNQFND